MSTELLINDSLKKSPQKVGRELDAERELARYYLAYWAACVERTGSDNVDQEAASAALEQASPAIEGALESLFESNDPVQRAVALSPVIYAGLARRNGLYLSGPLGDVDLRLLRYLQELAGLDANEYPDRPQAAIAAPAPAGRLHVCSRCTIVFEPAAKATATTCPNCHSRPHSDPPCQIIDLTEPGSSPAWKFTGVGHESSGYRRRCEVCGDYFESRRSHARVCPKSSCRRARSRQPVEIKLRVSAPA